MTTPPPRNALTATDLADSDQHLAELRALAAQGKAVATVLYPARGDSKRCWYRRCGKPTYAIVAALYLLPEQRDVAVCVKHFNNGKCVPAILAAVAGKAGIRLDPDAVRLLGGAP